MINDVSVCINNIKTHPNTVIAACKFAEFHKAKLTAIYIKLDSVEIARWSSSSLIDDQNKMLTDQQIKEEKAFALCKSLTNSFTCEKIWRTLNQSGNPIKQMLCTDIIFVDQPTNDPLTYYDDNSFISHLVLQTKRPIIMIPTGWDKDKFGTKILLGWNKSAEAMRAACDAVPIMQMGKSIEILDIVKNTLLHAEPEASPDINEYLLRKGVKSNLIVKGVRRNDDESEILVNYATDNNFDMIIVGGYGHSRLREIVMGGMTKYLIKNAPVPVLFSH